MYSVSHLLLVSVSDSEKRVFKTLIFINFLILAFLGHGYTGQYLLKLETSAWESPTVIWLILLNTCYTIGFLCDFIVPRRLVDVEASLHYCLSIFPLQFYTDCFLYLGAFVKCIHIEYNPVCQFEVCCHDM